MFFAILAAMETPATVVNATTNTPTVASTQSGACSGSTVSSPAKIRVSWTITNPSSSFEAKLYENNILQSTADTTASMTWDKTITGNVENGSVSAWVSDWVYRVDVVRKSDSQVVSSGTSVMWEQLYGGCGGGA